MRDVAIDEWMGASPIYTRRMQKLLGFDGDDVETIFKGMQLDIGAPPQFMDFRYSVTDDRPRRVLARLLRGAHGRGTDRRRLRRQHVPPHRGPDVRRDGGGDEPAGADASGASAPAGARRPRAALPVDGDDRSGRRRPSRARAGRPHRADARGVDRHPATGRRTTPTAAPSYDTPLEGDLAFETFSKSTLIAMLNEIALQGHLLTLSFADAVERRSDAATAADIVRKQFTGHRRRGGEPHRRGAANRRRRRGVRTCTRPSIHARYIALDVLRASAVTLRGCPAIGDRPGRTWADVLADGATEPLDAIVQAVDPHAYAKKVRRNAWTIERSDEAHRMSREVKLTRFSTGAEFALRGPHLVMDGLDVLLIDGELVPHSARRSRRSTRRRRRRSAKPRTRTPATSTPRSPPRARRSTTTSAAGRPILPSAPRACASCATRCCATPTSCASSPSRRSARRVFLTSGPQLDGADRQTSVGSPTSSTATSGRPTSGRPNTMGIPSRRYRPARAGGRRRRDHAVELPAPAQLREARPGPRRREHDRPEAGARHAVVRVGRRRA